MGKKPITRELIDRCSKCYNSDINNKVYSDVVIRNGLVEASLNNDAIRNMHFDFSHEIDVGRVTAQNKTARCWMFGSLNAVRYGISHSLKTKEKDFQLSQAYTFFWDKLEKANLFLEHIIETIDRDLSDHEVAGLLKSPQSDCGQWDMFAKLIEKYGVVPLYAMPETDCGKDSKIINEIMNEKLRQFAKVLRDMHKDGSSIEEIEREKENLLVDAYNIICHFLGEPPKTFDFEYYDLDGVFHRDRDITPLEFYNKYSKVKPSDYISIINFPTKDKPYGNTYSLKYLGSVVDDEPIKYLNLDIEVLRQLAIAQIKDGEQVVFGCDVGKMSHRKLGILDTKLYNYETVLNTKLDMTKEDRLMYRGTSLTHVMTLTGVNLVDEKPNRWKIQNSWGEEEGQKGFYIMSDEWFDEYVFKVIINKKHVSKEILEQYEKEPIILSPWDQVGPLF